MLAQLETVSLRVEAYKELSEARLSLQNRLDDINELIRQQKPNEFFSLDLLEAITGVPQSIFMERLANLESYYVNGVEIDYKNDNDYYYADYASYIALTQPF